MWSRFSYFPSISSSNGHFKFQRRGKIIKSCLNPSKGEYFSKIFHMVIVNTYSVDFHKISIWAPPIVSEISNPTSLVQPAQIWCFNQDRCATILRKIHQNWLVNMTEKCHCFLSTHLCVSIFSVQFWSKFCNLPDHGAPRALI